MSVVLPDLAAQGLDLIGISWPNVDEDAYRDMANSLREFADDVDTDAHEANQTVQRLVSSGDGLAFQALDKHWGKVRGKHLADLANAARIMAGALDACAEVIVAMKLAAIAQLAALAAEAAAAVAASPVTLGLSAAAGAAAIQATRMAVRRLIKEAAQAAVEYILSALAEPAVAALEGMAADLVIQVAANALDLQDGIDAGQAADAAKQGFADGQESAKDSLGLASAGTMTLASADGLGGLGALTVEHGEHDRAAGGLQLTSVKFGGSTKSKLGAAKGHHNRTRGRDEITAVIDPLADKAMASLEKAVGDLQKHMGDDLPRGVRSISAMHKGNDQSVRARLNSVDPGSPHGGSSGGSGNGPGAPSGGGRPPANGPGGGGTPPPTPPWHGRTAGDMRHHRRPVANAGGMTPDQQRQLVRDESRRLADDADRPAQSGQAKQIGQERTKKGCAGALVHNDVVTAHTSFQNYKGETLVPDHHPGMREALDETERRLRAEGIEPGVGHGQCSEVALISDRLHQMDPSGTSIRTVDDVRAAMDGAAVHTRQVTNHPGIGLNHGDFKPPCRSCSTMLPLLGVEVLN
ncbi:hypothetical protein SRB5_65410 [Streptomyces sp. RB5]|uniref:Outer membrane channel protein CpnT-like N-terminal domain-containing protein n=1 Tax=Streptomyces smaragdinus TaxID=2585196 RepID=A0A7K0CSL3_9ACTN|nr:YwqJ-related putative deaminase [Streptomyces smaragdinus]MQY16343.1 hypothetical protein [Streptomyces smaragdinus]